MRTFEEIKADVNVAMNKNDATTLLHLASELGELATPEARAFQGNARGWALFCTGDYPTALEHFNSSLALFQELGNRRGEAGVTNNICCCYYDTGDYASALEHYTHALALFQEVGDRTGVATVTGNIGLVYVSTGDDDAALYQYNSALAQYQELGDRSGVAVANHSIGGFYQRTGDFTAALEFYNIARSIHQELGERSGVARTTGSIIQVLLRTDEVEQARKVLVAFDELHVGSPDVAIGRELARAKIYVIDGDLQAAQTTLVNALAVAVSHGLRARQATICKKLRDLAQEQHDFAAYIEHNNSYTRINEEIRGTEAKLKIAMQAKQREIDAERKEHEKHMAVLHSTLPKHIADRVARGEVVNDHYDNASVIFLDIVGFTSISDRIPSGHVVHLLEQIFTTLDAVCEQHNVVKIKTIGDSYMAVSFGSFAGAQDDAVMNAASCALNMISSVDALVITMPPSLGDTSWTKDLGDIEVRIGMHCGPVTAGVIGTQRMQYDVWGDTVNVASRMESTGAPGRIHVSEAFAEALRVAPYSTGFTITERGAIEVKGKGTMKTYWLGSTT